MASIPVDLDSVEPYDLIMELEDIVNSKNDDSILDGKLTVSEITDKILSTQS